jgi:mannitol/fructose-specific phosphotransferase system IIA component (Ntr-type)
VKALSRISRLVRSEETRRKLVEAASADEFMALVAGAETA